MRHKMMGFWDLVASAGPHANNLQSAPRFRQITTLTPHHSIFTARMLFPTPNQQCQSTEVKSIYKSDMNLSALLRADAGGDGWRAGSGEVSRRV